VVKIAGVAVLADVNAMVINGKRKEGSLPVVK
jgi:hypothetical protein